MAETITSVRDCVAHMLQLCEYIMDCDTMPKEMTNWPTIVKKAQRVHEVLMEKGPPV